MTVPLTMYLLKNDSWIPLEVRVASAGSYGQAIGALNESSAWVPEIASHLHLLQYSVSMGSS